MEKSSELYKMYQVESVLLSKYGFKEVFFNGVNNRLSNECWLCNFNDQHYQIIRIVVSDEKFSDSDKDRIELYTSAICQQCHKEIFFLDIYINKNKYDESFEPFDYINLEENYSDGVDLKNIYPELYTCVHFESNPKSQDKVALDTLINALKERKKNLPFMQRHKCLFTYSAIVICVLMFIIETVLSINNDQASVLLFLGADYKLLTLGCHEYYRLFTYAFLHSSFVHLFCNMVSLWSIGRHLERKLGHFNFVLILCVSIVCGSLTQGILTDNSLCIGMSGGIYGLFVVYLLHSFLNKEAEISKVIPIVVLNILLNFLANVAWTCHLGGAIAGFALYFAITKEKNYPAIALVFILIIALCYKYFTISSIQTFYGGTDYAYVNLLSKFNFNVDNITNKIFEVYSKYGG